MKSSDMKKIIGLAVQMRRLSSDGVLLKIFQQIDFSMIRDSIDLINVVNSTRMLKNDFTIDDYNFGIEELSIHNKNKIHLFPIGEENYPFSLSVSTTPPAILYLKGNTGVLKDIPGVSVVGSRDISPAGEEITRRITTQLCQEKFIIISGLAIGVDASAHRAALQAKGVTIAVLAHGLEIAKPKQNARLGAEIIERGGAWVSEYPMGRPAMKQSFVQRNRIQVGLSAGSILVEASLNSGTMTQAEFANKEKRPIFAVIPHKPNNPLNLNCEGNTQLVNNNLAYPLKTKNDYEKLIITMNLSRDSILRNALVDSKNQSFDF